MIYNCKCGKEIDSSTREHEIMYCSACGKKLVSTCLRCEKSFNPSRVTDSKCPNCNLELVACNICLTHYPAGTSSCTQDGCEGNFLESKHIQFSPAYVNNRRTNSYDISDVDLTLNINYFKVGEPISDCIVYCDKIYFWKSVGSISSLVMLDFNGQDKTTTANIKYPVSDIKFLDLQGRVLVTCTKSNIYIHCIISHKLLFSKDMGAKRFHVLVDNVDVYIFETDGNQQKITLHKCFDAIGKELFSVQVDTKKHFDTDGLSPALPVKCGENIYFARFDKGIIAYQKNNNTCDTITQNYFVMQIVVKSMTLYAITFNDSGTFNIVKINDKTAASRAHSLPLCHGNVSYGESLVSFCKNEKGQLYFNEEEDMLGSYASIHDSPRVVADCQNMIRFFTFTMDEKTYVVYEYKISEMYKNLMYWDLSSSTSKIIINEPYRWDCSFFMIGSKIVFANKENGFFKAKVVE